MPQVISNLWYDILVFKTKPSSTNRSTPHPPIQPDRTIVHSNQFPFPKSLRAPVPIQSPWSLHPPLNHSSKFNQSTTISFVYFPFLPAAIVRAHQEWHHRKVPPTATHRRYAPRKQCSTGTWLGDLVFVAGLCVPNRALSTIRFAYFRPHLPHWLDERCKSPIVVLFREGGTDPDKLDLARC